MRNTCEFFLAALFTTGFVTIQGIAASRTAFAQTRQLPPPAAAPVETALTLSSATTLALAGSPLARAARFQLTQAQARLAQARAQTRRQITFSATGGVSNAHVLQPPPDRETFGTLTNTLTLPLPLGSRARFAVAQAEAQAAAAEAQFEVARRSLTAQVSAAYYEALRHQALLQIASDAAANTERQFSDAQKRFRAGDVPELDVLRAQVPLASAQANVFQARNSVTAAGQALNSLLGRSLDDAVTLAEVIPPDKTLPLSLEEARARAVQNSPEIRAAEAALRASELAYESARHSRDPLLSLEASDTRSNDKTGFSRLDGIAATITVPLSDGGLARAQINEAAAAREQARAERETARQNVLVAVSGSYLAAQSNLQQVQAAQNAQEIAQVAYDKTVRGYQGGLFPLTDVLTAQTTLTQARIAVTQAIYEAATAVFALSNATVPAEPPGTTQPVSAGLPSPPAVPKVSPSSTGKP